VESNRKIKNREPLLYIQQPEFKKPGTIMQELYYVIPEQMEEKAAEQVIDLQEETDALLEKGKKLDELPVKMTAAKEQEKNKMATPSETDKVPVPSAPIIHDRKPKLKRGAARLNPVKSFKELTIDEKLHFLAGYPANRPPYSCIFVTKENPLKGMLLSYNDGEATILQPNGQEVTIGRAKLIAIRISK